MEHNSYLSVDILESYDLFLRRKRLALLILLSVLAAEEGSTLRAIDSSGTLTQAQQDSLVACMERFKARKDGEGDAADA